MDSAASCHFSYSTDGEHFQLIQEFFQAKEGGWMGEKVGIFAQSSIADVSPSFADFDYVRIGKKS